jgi:catechol 2,3-dioxygenase-like lactoylglutathione lyase family enzyme
MPIELNHQIVLAKDKHESATFLSDVLGLPPPESVDGATPDFFLKVAFANGCYFLYAEVSHDFSSQHYAFLVTEGEFDTVLQCIEKRGIQYWADPARRKPNEYNTMNGGRGIYFMDPSGHAMEVLTRSE